MKVTSQMRENKATLDFGHVVTSPLGLILHLPL
jgi:hypothetical protein